MSPLRAAAAACLLLALPLRAQAAWVDFYYVEPGEGAASGGHFAIGFGDPVFHFLSVDGFLRLGRTDADTFRYVYSIFENRPVHVARVAVAEDTAARLRDHFNERYLIEAKQFAFQRALQRERRWLDPAADGTFAARGVGFFDADPGAPRSAALARLRERVGAAGLAARRAALGSRAPGADLAGWDGAPLAADRWPSYPDLRSDRLVERAARRQGLDAILEARPLRQAVLRELSSAPPLGAHERALLARFADHLEDRAVALLDSQRPDRGYPLLLTLARLSAVDASLGSGRWSVLDAFSSEVDAVDPDVVAGRAVYVEQLGIEARTVLEERRAALAARAVLTERSYRGIEEWANRTLEIEAALAEGRPLRLEDGPLVPRGEGRVTLAAGPRGAAARRRARAAERAHEDALHALYGYQLIARNCVSEVFANIDAVFDPEASRRRLGGHVGAGLLDFAPKLAFRAVKRRYRPAQVVEIPSYRATRLAALEGRGPWVGLRESNTFTSSIYRPNDLDSTFVFFTDGTPWTRPLLGVVNLVAGIGRTALGLLQLPFDRGAGVARGARGVVFSLPELAFVNLRKGSMVYARGEVPSAALGVPH
ncbi:MAG: hypothetical protein QNK03_19565 [Myxococcota bacterium]|nr:hypothetical protein [Myxococcota bacterium]